MLIAARTKLGATLIIAAMVVTAVIAAAGIYNVRIGGPLDKKSEVYNDLLADVLPPPEYVVEAWLEANLLAQDIGDTNAEISRLKKLRAEYESRKSYWQGQTLKPDVRKALHDSNLAAEGFWFAVDTRLLPAVASHDPARIHAAQLDLAKKFEIHRAAIEQLVGKTEVAEQNQLQDATGTMKIILVVLAFACIGLLSFLMFALRALNRSVIAPLSATSALMRRMANNDYSAEIVGRHRQDEMGEMARAMVVFRDNGEQMVRSSAETKQVVERLGASLEALAARDLTHVIAEPFPEGYDELRVIYNNTISELQQSLVQVSSSASSVNTGSSEIKSASEDLAHRTAEQAASLEETGAALSQVTQMVAKTAQGASQVSAAVIKAHKDARDGSDVVRQAVSAMDVIEKQSNEISQITSVIDGIAFQTNLLALNAGVEAARAGDAGKGFAVVANEVRALAQRAAEAAKDIKNLITASSAQIIAGVGLVAETGQMLERIAARINEVNALAADIETDTHAQASNLEEVNGAVIRMDRLTQQNAAMVEESTAASRSLASESEDLASLVARFRLPDYARKSAVSSVSLSRPESKRLRAA